MKLSFVIPCYRSQDTLRAVCGEIYSFMQERKADDYEIILVNDCSPDGTFGVISQLCKEDSRIVGVDLAKNFGQHSALMAGFHCVTGDVLVCLDDDGQTPADETGKLLAKIEEGYDVVYASYTSKKHSAFRNWGSCLNGKMTETMLGKPHDLQISSFFAAKRFIVEEMLRYTGAFPYVMGLVLRSTGRICNVPVNHRSRMAGSSGYTLKKLVGLWINGFTNFSVKPLRFANYAGMCSAGLGFLYALVIIVRFFALHTAPTGWSSLSVITLVLGGITLMVLGMMGEYIGRIYMSLNNAPQYVIRQKIDTRKDAAY